MSGYPNPDYPPMVNMSGPNQGQAPYPGVPQGMGGYPPMNQSPYPPQGGGFPGAPQPQGFGMPQPGGGYPGAMPQAGGGYPGAMPQAGGYPPQQAGYPGGPVTGPGYPGAAPMGGYPQQGGYPQMQQGGYPGAAAPGAYPGQQPRTIMTGQSSVMANAAGMETFQLSVGCQKLKDKDLFSKSDPVCIMYVQVSGGWQESGRTEKIMNNNNPAWQTKFLVDQKPGEPPVQLKFEVYDWDSSSNQLKKQDFLIRVEAPLATIVNSPGQQYRSANQAGKHGQMIINAERVTSDKNVVKIQLGARNLDNKDTFGKSDPFYVISKLTGQGRTIIVHKSNVVMNKLNPTWQPFSMSVRKLCNGDYNASLKIEVYDHDDNGKHDLIGGFSVTLRQLTEAMGQNKTFYIINPNKQNKKHYRNSGEVFVQDFHLWEAPSFIDPL